MSLTRTEAEAEILEVAGPWMALVSLSTTAGEDDFVASLNTALRAGFAALGLRPAARVVSDADFASVAEADEDKLIAVAKLSVMRRVASRWDAPNEKQNQSNQDWGDFWKQMWVVIGRLEDEVAVYGVGVPMLGVGLIGLGIIESDCDSAEFG